MSSISIKHVFGIRTSIQNSIAYLNEHSYVYPSSRHIIFYNIDYKSQTFINYGSEHDTLELYAVSPDRQYLAVVLNTLGKCRIIIYDIAGTGILKRKTLSLKQTAQTKHVQTLVFSSNSKFLLVLYGELEFILAYWSMDRYQCVAMISLQSLHIDLSHRPLHLQVSLNPYDPTQLLLTGNHIYRRYRLNNGHFSSLSQGQHQRCESLNITCHCWLNENHVLLGTQTGYIYTVNDHGDIIQQYHISSLDDIDVRSRHAHQFSSVAMLSKTSSSTTSLPDPEQDNDMYMILGLLPFSRGVFVSTSIGGILMYERNENSSQLTYLRRFILPPHDGTSEIIQSLALSPNEETLLVGTNENNLYEISFSKMDYTNKQANMLMHALDSAHGGSILTAGLCLRKPILFTLGIDQCLKLWNLQTNNQELQHHCANEPLSLSIHPTGVFIGISFWNCVQIYIHTIDGLSLFKQIDVLNARCIEYSHAGHMLTIAYDNILQLYQHSDYHRIVYTRVNDKKFRLIRWAHDDTFMISVDFDDVFIQWDPYTGQWLSQYRFVDFNVHDLVLSSDDKFAYLLSSDKKIKEFQLMTTIRDLNIPFDGCIPTALAIDDETQTLFVGSQTGSIYMIADKTQVQDSSCTNVHQGSITKILVSNNNNLMITTGEDGNINLYNLNSFQKSKESKWQYRDEILIKESLLKQQTQELNDLKRHELSLTHEYERQIETKENEYIEHLHQLDLHCQAQINSMQMKLVELRQEKTKLANEHERNLNELSKNKNDTLQNYAQEKTERYEKLLTNEQVVKSDMENFKTIKSQQSEMTNRIHQSKIDSIQSSYQDKIAKIKQKFCQETHQLDKRIESLEEMREIFDEENENELTLLHEHYLKKLKLVSDTSEHLENEEVLLKYRIEQLQRESKRFDEQINESENERNKLIDSIRNLEHELNLARQTIEQRNSIIQEKIERTNEMENRKDELEKFAYVFNYKIRELTNKIGPRQNEVQALIEQFNNMDNEYGLLNQNNEKYSIKIADCQARLRATEKELHQEFMSIRRLNETIANMNEDFKQCCDLMDRPRQLTKLIRSLYEKYVLDFRVNNSNKSRSMNLIDCERQRAYFERTNQRLQKKILLDTERHKLEQHRRIQEQIGMMREISSYCLKVVEVERVLSDLDVVSSVVAKTNVTTSNEIIHALKTEQGYNYVEDKQKEIYSILNQQKIRIEQLRDFIEKIA